jgi:hypothetical protein
VEPHHRRHRRRQERQHGVDVRIGDRPHRLRLFRRRATAPQPLHGLQAVIHARRDQFLTRGPLEDSFNAADTLVDRRPAQTCLDHLQPHCLEGQRPELCRQRGPVKLLQRLHRVRDPFQFSLTVPVSGRVVTLGESPVSQEHLVHAGTRGLGRLLRRAPGRHPFGDDAAVFCLTLLRRKPLVKMNSSFSRTYAKPLPLWRQYAGGRNARGRRDL